MNANPPYATHPSDSSQYTNTVTNTCYTCSIATPSAFLKPFSNSLLASWFPSVLSYILRMCRITGSFYGLDILSAIQPTVSKHPGKYRQLCCQMAFCVHQILQTLQQKTALPLASMYNILHELSGTKQSTKQEVSNTVYPRKILSLEHSF